LPFQADSIARLMYKIASEQAPDVRGIRPDLPKKLSTIVAFSLNKHQDARYQDGEKFAADLRSVMAELARIPHGAAAPRSHTHDAPHSAAPAPSPAHTEEPHATPHIEPSTPPVSATAFEKTTKLENTTAFDKTIPTSPINLTDPTKGSAPPTE